MFQKSQAKKYGNRIDSVCRLGHSHPSLLESSVCQILELRRLAGEFESIEIQKHVRVCGKWGHDCHSKHKVELVIDFKLTKHDGTVFYCEAKGMETPEYRIKRRMWIHNDIGLCEVWKGDWRHPKLAEVLCEGK